MSAEDYQRAIDFKSVSGSALPAGRDLDAGEISALVKLCQRDHTNAGARDTAIIGLLATCGLRRSELVNLDTGDIDTESGKLTIRSGKGNKPRTVYATNSALAALADWLAIRGQ